MTHDSTMVPCTLNGNWELILPRARCERAEWHTEAGWERARLDRMYEVIEPGNVVFDLGAECGDMSALYASWGADVVLVEPNWKAWEMIRAIFEANNLTHKVVASWAGFAGDAGRPVRRGHPWGEPWPDAAYNGEDSPYDFRVSFQYPQIPIMTVDRIRERVGRRVAVLTQDTEGAELGVMRGAEVTLVEDRPVCFISVHPDFMPQYGDTADHLHEFMASHGYVGEMLADQHEQHWCYTPA